MGEEERKKDNVGGYRLIFCEDVSVEVDNIANSVPAAFSASLCMSTSQLGL